MSRMAVPEWSYIPDLLAEHLEELGFVWDRWYSSLRAPHVRVRDIARLEERIRGHLQGILAVAPRARSKLEDAFDDLDAGIAFAAAYALLQSGQPEVTRHVVESFAAATEERRQTLGRALARGPIGEMVPRLWSLLDTKDASLASTAAEVLAFHGALRLTPDQLRGWLHVEEPQVRVRGWRLAALLDTPLEPRVYAAAMRDEDPSVRSAALEAGAWCRVEGVLMVARQLARTPSLEQLGAYYVLAVLGTQEDLPLLRRLADSEPLGAARFRLAGAYGSPDLVEPLIDAMSHPDPATAAAAGSAFTKLCGVDVESDLRVTLGPGDRSEPDSPGIEFLDEVTLPDPELARRAWAEQAPRLGRALRICRGLDLSVPLGAGDLHRFDMESRWELFLRTKFYGGWDGTPLNLEVFPQFGTGRE